MAIPVTVLLPLQNFFFPILGSFETLNQLGDCYPNPSSVLSEPVSSGAAFVPKNERSLASLWPLQYLYWTHQPMHMALLELGVDINEPILAEGD